jgi:archaetidylinositol phosphate synthase
MNKDTSKLEENIKNLLKESKLKEAGDEIKRWMEEKKENGFSFKLGELKVEYKRDEADTVNTAFTAKAEEKAKEWICPRLPLWVTPDVLTGIGVIGILMVAAGFVLGFVNRNYLILVVAGLIIHWFGDSFDGSIARYRKKTRPHYGYYIDKVVDAVSVVVLCLGLGLSGYVKIEFALLFGLAYMALMIHADLVVHVQNECRYAFAGFGPTEIRIVGIIIAAYMYFAEINYYDVIGHILTQYDFCVIAISFIMFVILLVSIIQKGIELNKQDTLGW